MTLAPNSSELNSLREPAFQRMTVTLSRSGREKNARLPPSFSNDFAEFKALFSRDFALRERRGVREAGILLWSSKMGTTNVPEEGRVATEKMTFIRRKSENNTLDRCLAIQIHFFGYFGMAEYSLLFYVSLSEQGTEFQ